MKNIIAVLVIVPIVSFASEDSTSPFVALHVGSFWPASADFSPSYGEKGLLSLNGSIGFPVSSQICLLFSIMRCQSNGTREFIVKGSFAYPGTDIFFTKTGSTEFREWMIHVGIQVSLGSRDMLVVSPEVGAALALVHEDRPTGGTQYLGSEPYWSKEVIETRQKNNFGAVGVFGGLSVERNLGESGLGLLAKVSYSYVHRSGAGLLEKYGGVNLTLGGKYSF